MGEIPHDWAELAEDAPWWAGAGDALSSNAVVGFGITAAAAGFQQFTPGAGATPSTGFGLVAAISGAPGFAVGAAAPDAPGFTVTGAMLEARGDTFNEFIQWRFGGVDLGSPTVQVVDFVDPNGLIEATRGVGDNAHVLTIKVTRQFLYFTSWLFPVDVAEAVGLSLAPFMGSLIYWPIEYVDIVSCIPLSGTLTLALQKYTFQLAEPVDVVSLYPLSGTLVVILNSYTLQLTEPVDVVSLYPLSGTLVVVLVSYTFQLTEPVDVVSLIPLSGTLV